MSVWMLRRLRCLVLAMRVTVDPQPMGSIWWSDTGYCLDRETEES